MRSMWSGSLAIKKIVTTKQSAPQAPSNYTNNIFTTSASSCVTNAIYAILKQSNQPTSNDTNNLLTILVSFGTNAIHATSEPSKQSTSNNTNNIFTTLE